VRLRKLLGAEHGKALTEAERANILAGKTAKGEDITTLEWRRILTAARAPVGYVDFTFSADKSVSLAWAFAPTEAERNAIAQAHRDAVHAAMRLVAETIGQARMGQEGRNGAEPGAIGWISFDHYAARPTLEIAHSKPDGTIETELAAAGLREPSATGGGRDSVTAVSVFIDRVKSRRVTVSDKSVVIIDELATIGTRQLLDLFRLQDRCGFRMVAIGDPKQCQAVEAGFVTRLPERALD